MQIESNILSKLMYYLILPCSNTVSFLKLRITMRELKKWKCQYVLKASKAISDMEDIKLLASFIHCSLLSQSYIVSVHNINAPIGLVKHDRSSNAHTYLASDVQQREVEGLKNRDECMNEDKYEWREVLSDCIS